MFARALIRWLTATFAGVGVGALVALQWTDAKLPDPGALICLVGLTAGAMAGAVWMVAASEQDAERERLQREEADRG